MLISFSKKFIFIHNYKVAGTSIRNALHKYESKHFYYTDRVIQRLKLDKYSFFQIFASHVKAKILQERLSGSIFDKFFKFGFVRNPWDWQVSLYNYMLKEQRHHQHNLIESLNNFEEYLDWRVKHDKQLQKDFFYDSQGKMLVDFVGKFENLTNDFNTICNILDLKDVYLPHLNISSNKKWTEFYTLKTFNIVKRHFKEDIDGFNYSDNPADYGILK